MSRLTKDYLEVSDHLSLDALIAQLTEIRDALPDGADARVKMRGDDNFGRHISVAFMRPLNAEETDVVERYAPAPQRKRLRAA